MKNKVYKAIEQWGMLDDCDAVVTGLSGGADSVSLLHILHEICSQKEILLCAVHVNHGIRGVSAMRDEQFCRRLCGDMGIALDVYSYDIPSLSQQEGTGLEECGRNYRYKSFELTARRFENCRIATAHTLSDSAETLLLNMTRGCGIAGLRGIPAVRGNIIRPLILASRDDIERYCADNRLEYMTDETNSDDAYSRNHIRLNVIGQLQRLNPSLHSAMQRLMQSAAQDEDYLDKEAQRVLKEAEVGVNMWQAEKLHGIHPAVLNRAIFRIITEISGKAADFTHIELVERMLSDGSGAVTLGGGKTVCLSDGVIMEQKPAHKSSEHWCLPAAETVTLPDGRIVRLEVVRADDADGRLCAEFVKGIKKNKYIFKSAVNCDIIKLNGLVRCRQEGDRFSPAGRGVTKTLKKLFNEAHIPPQQRDRTVIIEIEGKIVWIDGFGAAQGYQPAENADVITLISIIGQGENEAPGLIR